MKNTYTLLAVLLAVCTALPAAAQKNIANKVTRAVVSAEKAHKQHQPDAMAKKANPDTPVAPVCAACGEKITDPHQHCKATGYTGLCSAAKAKPAAAKADATTASCPRCHQPYTIDELYHGDKHTCPTAKTYNGPTGGEPECGVIFIESSEPAEYHGPTGGDPETNFFVVTVEDENASVGPTGGEPQGPMYQEVDEGALYRAEELLQADRDAHGGKPKHNLEYYYKQVTSVKK